MRRKWKLLILFSIINANKKMPMLFPWKFWANYKNKLWQFLSNLGILLGFRLFLQYLNEIFNYRSLCTGQISFFQLSESVSSMETPNGVCRAVTMYTSLCTHTKIYRLQKYRKLKWSFECERDVFCAFWSLIGFSWYAELFKLYWACNQIKFIDCM